MDAGRLGPYRWQARGDHATNQRVVALFQAQLIGRRGEVRGANGVGVQERQVRQVQQVLMHADVVAGVPEIVAGAAPIGRAGPGLIGQQAFVGPLGIAHPDPQQRPFLHQRIGADTHALWARLL
ncbi:hypothetical protein D3C80_1737080 [compost metagenome]